MFFNMYDIRVVPVDIIVRPGQCPPLVTPLFSLIFEG